jgi:dihydrolipoamide dehydrogenase
MTELTTETVVIGAGPGGYVAAIRLGQLGRPVTLIEKGAWGGVCLNVGCIPSKALIHATKLVEKIRHGGEMGLSVEGLFVDLGRLQEWKNGIVKKLGKGVKSLVSSAGAELLPGKARLTDPHTVVVQARKTGEETTVRFRQAILATGSRPIEIPGFPFDGRRVLNSSHALALTTVPESLLVVGGGYIGLELGMVYARLGSKVTVVEMLDGLLPGIEPDLVPVVARKLRKMGVTVHLRAKALGFEETNGRCVVALDMPKGQTTVEAEKILVTVGRKPVLDGLGLEQLDLERTGDGFLKVDAQRRTSRPHIYAIGDITGQPMLAHKASHEGIVAAEHIAGRSVAFDPVAIPAVVFTDPEIASTGLGEEQARALYDDVVVGKVPFAAIGRALTTGDTDGFCKVIADRASGALLGVHIVGNGASDLISEGTAALELGGTVEVLGHIIHPHPTLSEALKEAAEAALGRAIHVPNRR